MLEICLTTFNEIGPWQVMFAKMVKISKIASINCDYFAIHQLKQIFSGDPKNNLIEHSHHIFWFGNNKNNFKTRTWSMARHRKSPFSRRNLMVFDLLTPPQGHQFDFRVSFLLVSCSTFIPSSLIWYASWPCSEFFLPPPPPPPPPPPQTPPSPSPGAWSRHSNENPVWYVLYLKFVRRHTKFGLKSLKLAL